MTAMTTSDADLLRSTARTAFAALSPPEQVRTQMATERGWDEQVWRRLAGELGLPGLMLPIEIGGSGSTPAELSLVLEEAGAALLCAPLLSTAGLAVPLLLECDDDDALAEYAPGLASGQLTATVAVTEDDGRWRPVAVATTAQRTGGGWRLDGIKNYVVDGATAGLVLAVARSEDGIGVFAVSGDAAGLERAPLVTLDQTRKLARLTFQGTPATRVGPADATAAIDTATDVSRALLAAEQSGGAGACLDMTVAHAKTRIQFGQAIGSFQAVKQRLAEMLIQVESARSAAYAAGAAAATGSDLARVARIAAITCSDTYRWVSEQTIQLHGGIGFTWEHDAHLHFKRARGSSHLLGGESDHLSTLARILDGRDGS